MLVNPDASTERLSTVSSPYMVFIHKINAALSCEIASLKPHNLSTYFELAQLSLECSGIRCCSRKNGGGEVHEIKRKIVEYIYVYLNKFELR